MDQLERAKEIVEQLELVGSDLAEIVKFQVALLERGAKLIAELKTFE